jgi:hypothetical protein
MAHRLKSIRHGELGHIANANLGGLEEGNNYAAIGLRLKPSSVGVSVVVERVSLLINSGQRKARWGLVLNPAIVGPFTWVDALDGSMQVASGIGNRTTISGGTFIDGGFFNDISPAQANPRNSLSLDNDGSIDEMILIIRPLGGTLNAEACITYREIS